MKKKLFIAILLCVLTLSITACQSKEEKVLADLESVYNRVNTDADLSEDDWNELISEYEVIHKEFESCDFSYEQKKELARLEGKIAAKITKHQTKELGEELENALNSGGAIIEGFLEGLQEELEKASEE